MRDDFRRVTGIHYDDATEPRFTYDYGANGQAAYVKDAELGRTVWTEYDTSERPIRTHLMESVTSTSTGTPKYTNTLGYDEFGNVASFKEKVNNSASYETAYTYNIENQPTQLRYGADNRIIAYTYDAIGRIATRAANSMQTSYLTTYQYLAPENGDSIQTTPLVQSITQNGQNFSYTYDNVGNITSVTRNGLTTTYEYDSLGQLIRVNDPHAGKSTMYLYDCGSNMTGYLSAPYTLAPTLEGVNETVFYTYGDSNWKDKVTAIGGKAITYDAIGNPLTYDGWTFTWKAGRMLASMVKTGTNAQFTYDHNGMRIRKIVNGVTTNYTLNGKNVVHMTQGSNDLHFFYDAQGKPGMVTYNDVDYFYVYNLQGDVVALIDANGTQVVEYGYDAWGNPISKTGSLAATIGTLNPFRYRGYVYDEETGLYYLRSRYYNPVWKRFINADDIDTLSVNQGHIGQYNQFAYCWNNTTNMADESGSLPFFVISCAVGALIGGVIGYAASGSWKGAAIGALAGGTIGLTGGAVAGKVLAGSAAAHTGTVVARALSTVGIVSQQVYPSWQAAERALRDEVGSVRTVAARTFTTPYGNRIADAYNSSLKLLAESKYGYQSASSFIKTEVSKDAYLLQVGQEVQRVEWHFYQSAASNTAGMSKNLEKMLVDAGINIIKHY